MSIPGTDFPFFIEDAKDVIDGFILSFVLEFIFLFIDEFPTALAFGKVFKTFSGFKLVISTANCAKTSIPSTPTC
jgi:hypothetical protein